MRTKKTTTEEQTAGAAPTTDKKTKTVRKPRTTRTGATKTKNKTKSAEVKPSEEVKPAEEAKAIEQEVKDTEREVKPIEVVAQTEQVKPEQVKSEQVKPVQQEQKPIVIPTLPNVKINSIIDLAQAPQRAIVLNDQQIQQLTLEEIEKRYLFLEEALANVLDYDVVISDTNIWLELLVGHTSSHSDPRVNARLQFERQLEFISKLMKQRGGRFMIMGETYEEIDRFAAMQDPTNHKEADFTDNIVCLNAAARLAKRLILAQQRENRLKIEGISAESHHAAFADPAIVRRVVELFAEGKKVLLLTNDSSVAIRSVGLCDDLQRINGISDGKWNEDYAPLRPMVFTFDDLKLLDNYTRQLYYIQMAAGKTWMENVKTHDARKDVEKLIIDLEAFRPGDKHRGDNLFIEQEKTVNTTTKPATKPVAKTKTNSSKRQTEHHNEQRKQQAKAKNEDTTEVKPVEEAKPAEVVKTADVAAKPKKPRRRSQAKKKSDNNTEE